jgi:RHS repeat-associated protein
LEITAYKNESIIDALSVTDYYPFGMEMPGRIWSSGEYRFGFNGKEEDNEIKGEGNSIDFGARIYDSRIGRWSSMDPLFEKYPDLCPYNYSGNSPILFFDQDGMKFVNPYEQDYNNAKEALETSQKMYNNLVSNHKGDLTKKDIKQYLKASNLNSTQKAFDNIKPDYQEVEDYLYTLKATNEKEYNYFNTLTDAKGNEIDITIMLNGENPKGPEVGKVEGLAKYKGTFIPTADEKGLIVQLYEKGNNKETEFGYQSGRNYRTVANELGDIKYYFTEVHDQESYTKWEESANCNSPNYRTDLTGAGVKSEEYEDSRVTDVKNYAKSSLKEGENYNSYKNTIEKR